eukprot:gene11277-12457_t
MGDPTVDVDLLSVLVFLKYAAVCLLILALDVNAQCPVTLGNIGSWAADKLIENSNDTVVVATGLSFRCHGRLYGWNFNATKTGTIEMLIFSDSFRMSNTLVYSETFNVSEGLNIVRSRQFPTVSPNNTIGFIAEKGLVTMFKTTSKHQHLNISHVWHRDNSTFDIDSSHQKVANISMMAILQDSLNILAERTIYSGNVLIKYHGETFAIRQEIMTILQSVTLLPVDIQHHFSSNGNTKIKIFQDTTHITSIDMNLGYPVQWSWSSWSAWSGCKNSSDGNVPIQWIKYGKRKRTRRCIYENTSKSNFNCYGAGKVLKDCELSCHNNFSISGGILRCANGTISSSANAGTFASSENVTWIIERPPGELIHINITTLAFSTDSCRDNYLIVSDGTKDNYIGVFCGMDNTLDFLSCSNVVYVNLITDGEYQQFTIKYTTIIQSDPLHGLTTTTNRSYCHECGGLLTNVSGTIRSRLSPNGFYLPFESCKWTVNAAFGQKLLFNVTKFDVKLSTPNSIFGDSLKIEYGEEIQDVVNASCFVIPFHLAVVTFTTDRYEEGHGFIMTYKAFSPTLTTISTLTFPTPPTTTAYATLVSPNETIVTVNATSTTLLFSGSSNKSSTFSATTSTILPSMTPTLPTTLSPKTTAHAHSKQCKVEAWNRWSAWSSCEKNITGSYLGKRKRVRSCNVIHMQFNETCWSIISAKDGNVSHIYHQNATICGRPSAALQLNMTNGNSSALSQERCSFSTSNCNGSGFQTKECTYARLCNHFISTSDYSFESFCGTKCVHNETETCEVATKPVASSNCQESKETKTCAQEVNCNITNCGADWANWGECSQSCGQATRTRYAYCKLNADCDDVMMQSESCSLLPCAVDGAWTEWSSWSNCSKSCRGGARTRQRSCDNPAPSNGGLECAGAFQDSVGCNFFQCPVNGGFSQWTPWSYCDQPCGGGKVKRYRNCDSPPPAFGGIECQGNQIEDMSCNNHICKPVKVNVLLKFTREQFSLSMLQNDSLAFQRFSNRVKENLLQLYINRSVINDIVIHSLSEGSVICNFSVLYNQSAVDEFLIIQNSIEDVVPPAPISVTALSHTAKSITVSWSILGSSQNKTAGYTVVYKEFGTLQWQRVSTDQHARQIDLLMLKEFTLYTIRVNAFTMEGNGASSTYFDCYTKQGIPSGSPTHLKCSASSSATLFASWKHLDVHKWNGRHVGYRTRYKMYSEPVTGWRNLTNQNSDASLTIDGLKPFTRYEIEVAAVTEAGVGPFAWSYCVTDEDVPISPPSDVTASLLSRDGKMLVTWSSLPDGAVRGILKGYTVHYSITRKGTSTLLEGTGTSIIAPKHSSSVILSGFSSYTEVKISVSAFTSAGQGPKSPSVYIETCQCPKNLYVAWYSQKPYISGNLSKPIGILPDLLINATKQICQICNGKTNHSFGPVEIIFDRSKNGKRVKFQSEKELKRRLDNNAHFFLPIYGKDFIVLQKGFQFLSVENNAGTVLLIKPNSLETLRKMFGDFLVGLWPLITIVILMSTIVGSIVWLVDRKSNPNEFNFGSYIRGTFSGFWWGFVTMTTVGYGDITPRSFLGKLVAIFWMLIGPILSSIIVGSITSTMTAVVATKSTMMYGMSIAAIEGSFEHSLAIRRYSRVSQNVTYRNNHEVIRALQKGEVQGALIDSLSVASMITNLKNKHIEIGKFIKEPHGFGIVLSTEVLPLKENLRQYIESKRSDVLAIIRSYTNVIQVEGSSNDGKTNILASILDYDKLFKYIVFGVLIAIAAVSIISLLIRTIYRCCQRKRVSPQVLRLTSLEQDVCSTADSLISGITERLEALHEKHEKERKRWFAEHKYRFGVLGLAKFGTMNERKIKRQITIDEIMNLDLQNHQKSKYQMPKIALIEAVDEPGTSTKHKTLISHF